MNAGTLDVLTWCPCRRYLRARNFNPEAAFGQFKDTEEWRKENHLEQYYDQIDINEYDATRRLVRQLRRPSL